MTGVKQVRVRDHNGLARIEVAKSERALFCSVDVLDRVAEELKKLGFKYVASHLPAVPQVGGAIKRRHPAVAYRVFNSIVVQYVPGFKRHGRYTLHIKSDRLTRVIRVLQGICREFAGNQL